MKIKNLFSSDWEVEHKYYLLGKICNSCDSIYVEEADPNYPYSYSKTTNVCYHCGGTDLESATILRKIWKRYTIIGTKTKHSQELSKRFNGTLQMNHVLPKVFRLMALVKKHTNESFQNWFHDELLLRLPSEWINFGKEEAIISKSKREKPHSIEENDYDRTRRSS